jgi:hypothetical protein
MGGRDSRLIACSNQIRRRCLRLFTEMKPVHGLTRGSPDFALKQDGKASLFVFSSKLRSKGRRSGRLCRSGNIRIKFWRRAKFTKFKTDLTETLGPSVDASRPCCDGSLGWERLMNSGVATHDLPDEYFVLQIDGRVRSGHRRFADALRAALLLRDQFPQHDVKVRAMPTAPKSTDGH